jgi:hypothetical protein
MTARGIVILGCLWPLAGLAQSALPDTLACIRANLPEQATMRLLAEAIDTQGVVSSQRAEAAVRRRSSRSEISLRVTAPRELTGTAYLIRRLPDDDSTYVCLPAVGQVQRLRGAAGGTVLGTTLSADEIRHLLTGFADGAVSLGPRGRVHDWNTRRLSLVAPPNAAGRYDKIEVEITEPDCVAVESRFYRDNRLRKRITAAAGSLREQDGYRYAARFEASTPDDPLRSEIRILAIDASSPPDPAWFATDGFYRPRLSATKRE